MTLKFEHKEVVRSGSFVTLKNRRGFLRAGFEIEMHLKLGGAWAGLGRGGGAPESFETAEGGFISSSM